MSVGAAFLSGQLTSGSPNNTLGNVYAELALLSTGQLRSASLDEFGSHTVFVPGQWFHPAQAGIGSSYEARIANWGWVEGPYGNAWLEGPPLGVWITLDGSPSVWQRLSGDTSARFSTWAFDFEIRHKASGTLVASARMTLALDRRVSPGGGGGGGGAA